jgi:hypothetical protein
MRSRVLVGLLLLLANMEAGADNDVVLPMPASPLYVSECGSCHTAYAPGYLPARSWLKLMSELNRHFDTDASLREADRDLISRQLQALALDTPQANRAIAARSGGQWIATTPLRISTSPFFQFMHDEVPASFWQRPKVGSKANCGACHRRADLGRYRESEIEIPK